MMPAEAIFGPFLGMLVLTFAVWLLMYARRIPYIQANQFTDEEMTSFEFTKNSPAHIANPSDNLKNLFEAPVLF